MDPKDLISTQLQTLLKIPPIQRQVEGTDTLDPVEVLQNKLANSRPITMKSFTEQGIQKLLILQYTVTHFLTYAYYQNVRGGLYLLKLFEFCTGRGEWREQKLVNSPAWESSSSGVMKSSLEKGVSPKGTQTGHSGKPEVESRNTYSMLSKEAQESSPMKLVGPGPRGTILVIHAACKLSAVHYWNMSLDANF